MLAWISFSNRYWCYTFKSIRFIAFIKLCFINSVLSEPWQKFSQYIYKKIIYNHFLVFRSTCIKENYLYYCSWRFYINVLTNLVNSLRKGFFFGQSKIISIPTRIIRVHRYEHFIYLISFSFSLVGSRDTNNSFYCMCPNVKWNKELLLKGAFLCSNVNFLQFFVFANKNTAIQYRNI